MPAETKQVGGQTERHGLRSVPLLFLRAFSIGNVR
ncbi:CRISPR-associated DxTHG motif protein [Aromatoleum aromaticum]|nr:CRISPR-associated DxTHG motif protein [Aromatoleum aromaticum]